jgi:hypothetical protein
MENMSSGGFSAADAVVGGILDSGILTAIFAGLEPAGLLYMARCSGESPCDASCQSGCPMSIHRHKMGLASGRIHP